MNLSAPPLIPSYGQGFRRQVNAPRLLAAWAAFLGPNGLTVMDHCVRGPRYNGTLVGMVPGTDIISTEKSWVLDFDGTQYMWTNWFPDPRYALSVACTARVNWVAANSHYLFGCDDAADHRFYLGDVTSGAGDSFVGPLALTSNEWRTWFLILEGTGRNAYIYEDMTLINTIVGYTSGARSDRTFNLGQRSRVAVTDPVVGQAVVAYAWETVITPGQMQEVIHDPYCHFREAA